VLKLRCLLPVLALAFAVPTTASAEPAAGLVYRWVEANGNLKFSGERPAMPVTDLHVYRIPSAPAALAPRALQPTYGNVYDPIIEREASARNIPVDLVRAVIQVESGFNARARSPKGAMGLMQLMPATAAELGVPNPYDPTQNIRGGVTYLRQLLDRYDNNEELALAAYNAGPEAVGRYGNQVPPYPETRDYVQRITFRGAASGDAAGRQAVSRTVNKAPARTPASAPTPIYLTVETIEGRAVPRYSDTKPASGLYSIVSMR
jgi:soluble lytic murein transglycosylase-like protein